MDIKIAENINVLGAFCGKRDVAQLTRKCLFEKYGFEQADVMVLFGGSILAGGDVLANAIAQKVAKKFLIVGGIGHTTETLQKRVQQEYPAIETDGLSEAQVFQQYLATVYGCKADFLETESTNCGNNITNLLALLKENHLSFHSIILCQDATMQNRMDAGMRKYASAGTVIINYASYCATVVNEAETGLSFTESIHGMWDMARYINLLMGEIPRLTDNENGYGPKGKQYIAHVTIPTSVNIAFESLKSIYGDQVREANPLYASK